MEYNFDPSTVVLDRRIFEAMRREMQTYAQLSTTAKTVLQSTVKHARRWNESCQLSPGHIDPMETDRALARRYRELLARKFTTGEQRVYLRINAVWGSDFLLYFVPVRIKGPAGKPWLAVEMHPRMYYRLRHHLAGSIATYVNDLRMVTTLGFTERKTCGAWSNDTGMEAMSYHSSVRADRLFINRPDIPELKFLPDEGFWFARNPASAGSI